MSMIKFSIKDIITKIQAEECFHAVAAKHITDSFTENSNMNKTVDFILKSLK